MPFPAAIVDDFSDDEDDEEIDAGEGASGVSEADLSSDEITRELTAFFGANADTVKRILNLWNAYADVFNACDDDWIEDTDAYREERAFLLLKAGLRFHELLNGVSNFRHKSWYAANIWAVASRQMLMYGNLWRFSTRSVEGRGGRLKHIGRRMICWRRRSTGKYKRQVRGKVIEQTYTSAPERQLLRAAVSREERAHTQQRSRVATTGRKTLKREGVKFDAAAEVKLGGEVECSFVKKMCVAAAEGNRTSVLWRA